MIWPKKYLVSKDLLKNLNKLTIVEVNVLFKTKIYEDCALKKLVWVSLENHIFKKSPILLLIYKCKLLNCYALEMVNKL